MAVNLLDLAQTIVQLLTPFIGYMIAIVITFYISKTRLGKRLLYVPVVILVIYVIGYISLKIAGL